MFHPHAAGLIDYIGFGEPVRAILRADPALGIAGSLKRQARPFQKRLVGSLIPIHADPQNYDTGALKLPAHGVERRHFFDAGRTPGSPEVEDEHTPSIVIKTDRTARIRLDLEIRRPVANVHDRLA